MISGQRYSDKLYFFSDGQNKSMVVSTPLFLNGEASQLQKRKVSVKSITIDTTNIPRFIPKLWSGTQQNFNTQCTTNNFITANVTWNITNYSFTLRKKDNSIGVIGFVDWVSQSGTSPSAIPQPFEQFNANKYTNPYYQLRNFSGFLEMISKTIDKAITVHITPTFAPTSFYYDAATSLYELSVDKNILDDYYLEFDDNLNNLFFFNTTKILINQFTENSIRYIQPTHRLIFPPIIYSLDTYDYYKANSEYSNEIMPYQQFIIYSPTYPIFPTNIRTSQDQVNEISKQYKAFITIDKEDLNAFKMPRRLTVKPKELSFSLHTITGGFTAPQMDMRMAVIYDDNPNTPTDWLFEPGQAFYIDINAFDVY